VNPINSPTAVDPPGIRSAVEALLHTFLDDQEQAATTPELALFTGLLRDMLAAGGKRIRPVLCVTGWQAVSHQVPPPMVFRVAASLELFHAFALIHDDIMDNSTIRRGRPTAHRILAARFQRHPNSQALGTNAAILLGDLALGWSYELLHPATPAQAQPAIPWPVLNTMRTETLIGQYLDLLATGPCAPNLDTALDTALNTAWKVIRYKTAKYTFEHPLHLGALLAGATQDQLRALSAYALPLGEAFQLRDDLLGVFGNPDDTGKPSLDDLRQGKHTVLITIAYQRATPTQTRLLQTHLGNPSLSHEGAQESRAILIATGAVATVEQMIADRHQQALDSLNSAPLCPAATTVLRQLATATTIRAA
jgi:geranylgeranyl diphosphate synthase, type I